MIPDEVFNKSYNSWRGSKPLYPPFKKPYAKELFPELKQFDNCSTKSFTWYVNTPYEHDELMRWIANSENAIEVSYNRIANSKIENTYYQQLIGHHPFVYYLKNFEGFKESKFGSFYIDGLTYFQRAVHSIAFERYYVKHRRRLGAQARQQQFAGVMSQIGNFADTWNGFIRRRMIDNILFDEYNKRFK